MGQRPNTVLILADDMGYGDVEFINPESRIPTPEMNALARRTASSQTPTPTPPSAPRAATAF